MICQNCNEPFQRYVVIDGKSHNLSSRKFCLKCSPFGRHNTRGIVRLALPEEKVCKRCNTLKGRSEFYTRRNGTSLYHYCILCVSEECVERQRAFKIRAIEYKGGKCVICGYSACPAALDFHHVDPMCKDLNISQCKSLNFDRIKVELDKCVLLCSRCHREVEDGFTKLPELQDQHFQRSLSGTEAVFNVEM